MRFQSPPYIYTHPLDGGYVSVTGFYADLWHELRRATNFTYRARPSRDGTWGRLREDGTYDGMMGMLLDGEAEVAVADFYVTADRALVADFSVVLAQDDSVIMVWKINSSGHLMTFLQNLFAKDKLAHFGPAYFFGTPLSI